MKIKTVRGLTGLVAGATALVGILGGCAGTNVSYQSRLTGIPNSRVEELKKLPDYQLSDEERCELAERNNRNHRGELHNALTVIGSTLNLSGETVVPCYINKTMPGKRQTDMIFFVKKRDGTNITYHFDETRKGLYSITVQMANDNGMTRSFYPSYPEDKEIINKGERNIQNYLTEIENVRNERTKIDEQKRRDVLKNLEK
ncbi:hypothetical protein HY449_04240 [Candidatus Pacearchaeota archaeon]|nr:hypothetical protein [Candidatus Pacearchaeota archaeon]